MEFEKIEIGVLPGMPGEWRGQIQAHADLYNNLLSLSQEMKRRQNSSNVGIASGIAPHADDLPFC
jgi:hypothetical protein